MIRFFYSGCYKEFPDGDVTPTPRLTLHIEMYSLADKYDVPKLGEVAAVYFHKALEDSKSSGDYLPCVPAIYESTPDSNTGLRSVIVKYVVNRGAKQELSKSLLKAAFIEAPQFGWDCFFQFQRHINKEWRFIG